MSLLSGRLTPISSRWCLILSLAHVSWLSTISQGKIPHSSHSGHTFVLTRTFWSTIRKAAPPLVICSKNTLIWLKWLFSLSRRANRVFSNVPSAPWWIELFDSYQKVCVPFVRRSSCIVRIFYQLCLSWFFSQQFSVNKKKRSNDLPPSGFILEIKRERESNHSRGQSREEHRLVDHRFALRERLRVRLGSWTFST